MATIDRLRKRPDFLAAAEGRRLHTERMTVQGRPREGGAGLRAGLRLGITVTKRVGNAVERNRVKRRLRAATRAVAADLSPDLAALPADIVLIARRPTLAARFPALVDDLRRALPQVTRPGAPPRGPRRPTGAAGAAPAGAGRPRRGAGRAADLAAPSAIPNARTGVPDGQ